MSERIKLVVLCAAGIKALLLSLLIPSIRGKKISIMDNIRYECATVNDLSR